MSSFACFNKALRCQMRMSRRGKWGGGEVENERDSASVCVREGERE